MEQICRKRKGKTKIHKNMEGPVVLKPEIRSAPPKISKKKATGIDEIQWRC